MSNFLNIHLVGAELFHVNRGWMDGRTERHDSLIAIAPKNRYFQEISRHLWNSISDASQKPATGLLM
jgi:hypothetical protein